VFYGLVEIQGVSMAGLQGYQSSLGLLAVAVLQIENLTDSNEWISRCRHAASWYFAAKFLEQKLHIFSKFLSYNFFS
jgi:hypothetical protein